VVKFVWRREYLSLLENLDNEAILRLVAVTQSGAYSGVCEHLRRKPDAKRARYANFHKLEALTNSEEILSLQSSTTNQTTINILLSEDLGSV
jgi:hypothetical protein